MTALAFWIAAAILTQVFGTVSVGAEPTRQPNIVFIIADDLGYGELGCYGGSEIPTPRIDALAADGLRLTDGYVTASYCAASRAGLMTARYQTRFGFESNPIGAQNCDPAIGLPVDQPTLADHLRAAGYATALIGKWHLGGTAAYHPQRRGFDEFFGFLHEGHFFVPPPYADTVTWLRRKQLPAGVADRWTSPDGRLIWSAHMGHNEPPYDTDNPILRSSQPVEETANLTDAFTREACDFIDRHASQPFGLVVAYNAVHSPLQAELPYFDRFDSIDDVQRRIFAAMLAHLDDGVGRIVDAIARHDLEERTIVVFISDNGGPTKELTSSNAPLRGGKGTLYEGGIRVPMIVSWPGNVAPAVSSEQVTTMDLSRTLTELAGAPIDAPFGDDGKDLRPLFDGQPFDSHETLFWRMGKRHALRHGNWKLVRHSTRWELYDLATDPSEANDQAASRSDIVSALNDRWEVWNAEQATPLW